MSQAAQALAARVGERLDGLLTSCTIHRGQVTVEVPAARLLEASQVLCNDPQLLFRQLVDLCGVDYLDWGKVEWETSETASADGFSRGVQRSAGPAAPGRPRFAVVYQLLSHAHNRRLRMRTFAEGEPPRVDSVVALWPSANWFEREAFDLFGILFDGHPDLRRILTDYGFVGHPFRKDFPLIGEVELRYDPERRRVVYEPVSIQPRTLVPKVIRREGYYAPEADVVDDAGSGD